jgi:hypothetical protein
LKDALDNGLIKPKHVVLLMYIFNCGGDGFYDCLIFEMSVYFYQTKWRNTPDDISFPLDASKQFAPVTIHLQ